MNPPLATHVDECDAGLGEREESCSKRHSPTRDREDGPVVVRVAVRIQQADTGDPHRRRELTHDAGVAPRRNIRHRDQDRVGADRPDRLQTRLRTLQCFPSVHQ